MNRRCGAATRSRWTRWWGCETVTAGRLGDGPAAARVALLPSLLLMTTMRRALSALLLLVNTGCLSFRELSDPRIPAPGDLPSTLRVVRTDGTSQMLANVRLVADTIYGVWPTNRTRLAVPVSQVARLEVRRFDGWRTALLGGVVDGLGVALWLWIQEVERPVNGVCVAPCPFPAPR